VAKVVLVSVIALLLVLFSQVARAQAPAPGCSPVGTWYGGGDGTIKYIAVVTPIARGRFQLIFHGAYDMTLLGFPVTTLVPGEFRREKHGEWDYVGTAVGLAGTSASMPPATLPHLLAVRYRARLDGCNKLLIQHDFFGGYLWGARPLIDPPAYVPAATPIDETYQRLSSDCPACQVP
jgi:hypothetical protein